VILLFTGSSGRSFGYEDFEDDEGVFHYYGEGQEGPMEFKAGNKAIRDHAEAGKELLLFEQERRRFVRYRGSYVCAGFESRDGVPDVNGNPRRAIIFQLVRDAALADADGAAAVDEKEPPSLAALRKLALESPAESSSSGTAKRKVYRRSAALKRYVLARSEGTCEGCGREAPFATPAGTPYLEPHHAHRLSDGGPDRPDWVIALCPNCHARVHHGEDGSSYNQALIEKLPILEADVSESAGVRSS
jgi:5-methylcytosine-specific restriction protein A